MLFSISAASADQISYTYTFSPSTPARSAEVNSNFASVATVVNGNIDNNNLKSGAGISLIKLNLTQELPILRAAANRVFSAGNTGDTEYRAVITSDGRIELGPGGSSARDVMMKRSSAGVVAIRNIADNADADASLGNVTLSGVVTGNSVAQIRPGGRLTLTSQTPVTAGDVASAGTLYYTPDVSNLLPSYSSSLAKYTLRTFSELSLTLSISNGTNYDVWSRYNAGNFTLSVTAWTNDTTRATALARSSTSGLLYKSGDEEYLYLGTIRGSGSNVTEDSAAKRYVWNMYNRRARSLKCEEPQNSWTYTTATVREARGQSTEGVSRVGFVRGLDEDSVTLSSSQCADNSAAATLLSISIGLDSAARATDASAVSVNIPTAGYTVAMHCHYAGAPGLGYHTLRRLEYSQAAGTTTWYGDANTPTILQSGAYGACQG